MLSLLLAELLSELRLLLFWVLLPMTVLCVLSLLEFQMLLACLLLSLLLLLQLEELLLLLWVVAARVADRAAVAAAGVVTAGSLS